MGVGGLEVGDGSNADTTVRSADDLFDLVIVADNGIALARLVVKIGKTTTIFKDSSKYLF
jgi:hypothetical protein